MGEKWREEQSISLTDGHSGAPFPLFRWRRDLNRMESTLKKYFGYSHFRPYQKEIIQEILNGRDSLVVMATGSGKSLCYQIPPLVTGKCAVVISPLLSLMQDQVMSLKQRGIKAEYLGSTQRDSSALFNAEHGHFSILYMTPEKACSFPFKFWSNLSNVGISLLAVDEAHCISEWGHDFRKEYKQLDKLRGFLVNVPFVGLTATATEKVRMDIINSLKMKDPYIAVGSFDRKNLFYHVEPLSQSLLFIDKLVGEVSKCASNSESTIIYCTTVKDTEQVFKSLSSAGIKAGIYHGQMSSKAREESHRLFIRDELDVMVATVAFGMGIDKPNIRCVIHYDCPKSLESYYQESGRCGRDGIASSCYLYYTRTAFGKAEFYCGEAQTENQRKAIMESLIAAQKYCVLTTCRRKFLLEYFGEKVTFENCGNCDNCIKPKTERDLSSEAFLLLNCIRSCGGRWGLNMPVDVLRGSRSKKILDNCFDKLPVHGLGREHSSNWWKALGDQLMAHGYLKEAIHDVYRTVSVSERGLQFLRDSNSERQPPLILPIASQMVDEEQDTSSHVTVEGDLQNFSAVECEGFSEAEVKLYHSLVGLRKDLAKRTETAPYAICGDQTIKRIAKTRPSTKARLANIDGVNQHLVTVYGDHILMHVGHVSEELNLPLDGEGVIKTAMTKKVNATSQKNLAPAKLDAWRMWQEDGLTFEKIANYPARAAPIKEQTVFSYVLEAAQEGFQIDWARFLKEIDLTVEVVRKIEDAIVRVGSKEKLKPIKEELPEDVTYTHIKVCLVMQDLGISVEELTSSSQPVRGERLPAISTESSAVDKQEISYEANVSVEEPKASCSPDGTGLHCVLPATCTTGTVSHTKHLRGDDSSVDAIPMSKHPRINNQKQDGCYTNEVTDGALLDWIGSHDGVAHSDIIEHFKGNNQNSVVNMLNSLEGEFLIFRKNGLYRVM